MKDTEDNNKNPDEQYKRIKKGLNYISLQMEILRDENKQLRANNKELKKRIEELKQDKERLQDLIVILTKPDENKRQS